MNSRFPITCIKKSRRCWPSWDPLNQEIKAIDAVLGEYAEQDAAAQQLMTVPAVGPVIALSFVATVDRADRFQGPHQLAGYLGLVPREWSSSEKQRRGPITKPETNGPAGYSGRPPAGCSG